ncbi:MAG: RNA polymerase sigma factor [Planctomycetaceae bacterium]
MNSPNLTTETAATVDEDDALMIRLQEGDRQAFPVLVNKYQQSLLNFFYSNTRDRQLSEDLTQDTLLKVYDQSWDYIPSRRFRGWMFRVARNLLIDSVRRRTNDALVQAVWGQPDETPLLDSLSTEDDESPVQTADRSELTRAVDALLPSLPEEQLLTFTLHHFAGLSLPEVAEILEASVATTKSRLRLAREKLREELEARGFTK